MEKIQSLAFLKKPKFILALILVVFFLKGVFLTTIIPIFEGQDEARHYNTIQYVLQPQNVEKRDDRKITKNNEIFADYNFSEEILNTGTAAGLDLIRDKDYNKIEFQNNYVGENEVEINKHLWQPYNYSKYPDIVSSSARLFHKTASFIEKTFSDQSILIRFYLIRIFSVFLGMLVVLLSYFIAKNIGFASKHSLLLAAIISFQPRFSIYYTNINYDVLFIFLFTLFILGGILAIKHGINWKNLTLLVVSAILGILAKQTGAILLVAFAILIIFFGYKKIRTMGKNVKLFSFIVSLIAIALFFVFLEKYIPNGSYAPQSVLSSAGEYLSKTLPLNKLISPSETYWGALEWTNSEIVGNAVYIIWSIQFFAAVGIAIFFFSKKYHSEFLPEKKYVVFLLVMIALLQLGIRFADWSLFQTLGRIETGLPGRYFLPNIAAHIILVFIGIGALIEKIALRFKKSAFAKKYFENSLIVGLILMMTFMMYIIFDVIIYRYYL